FYQLDLEMSFVTQEDVWAAIEPVMHGVFAEFRPDSKVTPPPFPRIPYDEALARYGSDKPDLRNPLVIEDVTEVFRGGGFAVFARAGGPAGRQGAHAPGRGAGSDREGRLPLLLGDGLSDVRARRGDGQDRVQPQPVLDAPGRARGAGDAGPADHQGLPVRHRLQRRGALERGHPQPPAGHHVQGVRHRRLQQAGRRGALRRDAERLPLRRADARRLCAGHRPDRDADRGREQHPRGHRLPDEPAGAGPPHAGAGAGAARAVEGAAHQARSPSGAVAGATGLTRARGKLGPGNPKNLSDATVITRRLSLAPDVDLAQLLGRNDDHLRTLESQFEVRIVARGHDVMLKGDERQVVKAERALTQLAELVRAGAPVRAMEVRAAARMVSDDEAADVKWVFADAISVPARKKWITPKGVGQKRYVDAIRTHDMVFGIGPAGTGKSFLAVAMAVNALMKREVARIVLTRPAVEAGERLGFLPGDLYEKVHPYLRPLYDALYDMLEAEKVAALMEKGAIEIAPLAYMRGRTLNDAFIILDEAQNSTTEQMKMFLTRLGFNSKMVVTGDITQVDLPASRHSGLIEVQRILRGVPGIDFVYFDEGDVVRHRLVSAI